MANLKDLKNRIKSVKSTQKITKAMKMVAASKLRRAQERAEEGRPYAEKMERMIATLAASAGDSGTPHPLLTGTGKDTTHLLVVLTSDRGLCGGFNSNLVRAAKHKIIQLQKESKTVKLLVVGKKGYEQLKTVYANAIVGRVQDLSKKKQIEYVDASDIAQRVLELFDKGEFDVCHLVFNTFVSAIAQKATFQQLIPLDTATLTQDHDTTKSVDAVYDYEPNETEVLAYLLPRNIGVQIYHGLLESVASEQGARMSAMDNATRNAGDMIGRLTLLYNRTRQAAITRELIEIISGAEAV